MHSCLMARSLMVGLGLTLALSAFGAGVAAASEERLHHDLKLDLDPAAGRLDVIDRIQVSGHTALALKLAPGLDFKQALIGGDAVSPTQEDGVLWIALPKGEENEVTLSYGGVLKSDDHRGSLSPLLTADGGFLPYGLGWLANGGAEDNEVTFELTVTAPSPYQAVATGEMTAEDTKDGAYRATFVANHRTEPPSVFAGNFAIDERDHQGIRLRTYFPADQQQLASTYLDQAGTYLDLFENRIGTYPYDGFSMIAAPLPVGMGFPGFTYISAQILRMPFMQTRSLAHEILHNWWANGVFIDYDEGNWAEGLTTYMADYALAEAEGPAKALEMRQGWLRDFTALPEMRDQPLTDFRSKGHDADQVVGYNKVAFVLHMLRQEIGKEAFEAGLKSFWAEHQFKSAAWSDIQVSFEHESGQDLEGFFKPWLTTKGAPRLALDKAEVRETESGFELDIELSSDRDDYNLLVPVQIETEDGIDQTTLRVQDGAGAATFSTDSRPLSIGIDQQQDLFRYLAEDEAPPILRDVTLDQDALTVILTDGDRDAGEIAKQLAERTLDTGVRLADIDDSGLRTAPLMLISLTDDIAPALAKVGIETVPEGLEDRGSARSWVAKRETAPPVLVVEAADKDALGALLRPFPHYGRQSYLVFEGREVVDKGIWPTGDNALTKSWRD